MTCARPGFQTEVEFELPKGYVDETGTLHRRGIDAARHRRRRDPAAARSARAAERGLSRRHRAGARDHRGSARCRTFTPASSKGCTPPTSTYLQRLYEKFNASDDGSAWTVGGCRDRRRPARRCGGFRAWGKHEGLSRESLYEEMAFIAHHFHWSHGDLMQLDHARAPALVPGDLGDQPRARRRAGEPVRRLRGAMDAYRIRCAGFRFLVEIDA